MSLNASALRLMMQKGLSMEDVVEIAEAMEQRRDNTAADRQQRRRDKVKAEKIGSSRRDVTRDGSPNDIYSNPLPVPSVISNEMTSPPIEIDEGETEPTAEPISLKPEHVVEAWNDMAGRFGLPTVRTLTEKRRRQLCQRIRQHPIEDWTEAIGAIERSPFLRGENDRGWRADFDFLLQPSSFVKLIEGSYDRTSH